MASTGGTMKNANSNQCTIGLAITFCLTSLASSTPGDLVASEKTSSPRLADTVDHAFLDDSYRQQRTTFADGTTVTIDLEKETFDITPPLDMRGASRTMRYTLRSADDARAWQRKVREKLSKLLGIGNLLRETHAIALQPMELSSEDRGNHKVEQIEISSTPGRRMRIIVTVPTQRAGPRPAVVCIGGHGSTLVSPYAEETISKDRRRAKADIIYRGFGTALARRGYVTISTTVSQHEIYEADRLLMAERLWDLMRCVDYLESLPSVDKSKIGCAGLSLGGEMTMWLGAMDERIAATISAGFLTTMDQMEQNHCMCWKFGGLRDLVDFADIYSLIAPRPLQCQNGLLEPASQFCVPLARQALKEISPIYSDMHRPENLLLDVHKEGHVIDLPALLTFFEKHLAEKQVQTAPGN